MKYIPASDSEKVVKQDYSKAIQLRPEDFGNDGHMLQTVTIPPQTKQREHYHHIQTEVFYILKGECEIYMNGTMYLAKSGDAFICSPNDRHYLWNKTDNDFGLVVFKIDKPVDDDDTVWSDK